MYSPQEDLVLTAVNSVFFAAGNTTNFNAWARGHKIWLRISFYLLLLKDVMLYVKISKHRKR